MKNTNKIVHIASLFVLSGGVVFWNTPLDSMQCSAELNPYGKTPLAAILDIDLATHGKVHVKVLGKGQDGIDIEKEFDYEGSSTRIPVFGLYSGYTNMVEVSFFDRFGRKTRNCSIEIQTEDISKLTDFQLNIIQDSLSSEYQGLYLFVGSHILFDQRGEPRWFLFNDDYGKIFTQLQNGNILIESEEGKVWYHAHSFSEMTMFGEVVKEYVIPHRFHHEILEMPNGNFLTLGSSQDFDTRTDTVYRDDTIIEIERDTGDIVKEVNLDDILYGIRPQEPKVIEGERPTTTGDWAHANGLSFDGDMLIVSMKEIDAIASIDFNNVLLNWILFEGGEEYASTREYTLTPTNTKENQKFFPSGQHTATVSGEEKMLLFDNGNMNKHDKKGPGVDDSSSRVLEYKINKEKRTIELIWEYYPTPSLYTPVTGSSYYTNQGTVIIGFTDHTHHDPKVLEITRGGTVLFEADEVSGERYYRVYKIDL